MKVLIVIKLDLFFPDVAVWCLDPVVQREIESSTKHFIVIIRIFDNQNFGSLMFRLLP